MVFPSNRVNSRTRRCGGGFRAQQLRPDFTIRILGAVHIDVQIATRETHVLRIGQPDSGGDEKTVRVGSSQGNEGRAVFPTAPS